MEEAIDIIQTDGKIQKIQTILSFLTSCLNTLIITLLPYLLKKPYFLCSNPLSFNSSYFKCSEEEYCNNHFFTKINYSKTLNNWNYKFSFYCENKYYISLLINFYFIGGICASIFFTYLGDKFGRKLLFKKLSISILLCYFLLLFSFKKSILIFTFFLFGISSFSYIMTTLIITEILNRTNSAFLTSLNTSSGFIFAMLFYLIFDFFNNINVLFLILTVFSILNCFYIHNFFHESLFWLISKNRINECFEIMKIIALYNDRKRQLDNINRERFGTDKIRIIKNCDFIWTIFKYDSQKKRLIIHMLLWFFSGISFYSFLFNISFIELNYNLKYFITYFIISLTEILIGFISDKFGRLTILTYSFYLSGISYFIYALIPNNNIFKPIAFIFIIIGCSSTYTILFIFTSEDFPTSIRCTIMGFMFIILRISAIFSYFFSNSNIFNYVLFACLSCISGRLSESLEDTFDLVLDDEVPECYNDTPFKKKLFRALKKERKSTLSDLYFLTSDDESFNKGQIYI